MGKTQFSMRRGRKVMLLEKGKKCAVQRKAKDVYHIVRKIPGS